MKLILDTNRYHDLDEGAPEVTETVRSADMVRLPFVVLLELHAGFRLGTKQLENQQRLRRFLAQPGVEALWPDDATISVAANLSVQLRKRGKPIPAHDIWIAALAIQHQLTLYSRDKHFDHLPQLSRI